MRRSLTFFLSFALSIVLIACGGDDSGRTSAPTSDGEVSDSAEHDHAEPTPVADGARRIEVDATSFAFGPEEITVAAGEDVAIVLTSDDLLHDFAIDGVDVHVAAERGETAIGGLRVDEPGIYTYYCTVAGHRDAGMEGTLVVEPA